MSEIFGADNSAALEQMRLQQEQIAKQEASLNKQQTELAQRTQAGIRARRAGGQRALLSAERPDELGVQPTKLGGG